jgi:adenylate cyclase class 2
MPRETEIKFLNPDMDALRRSLQASGADFQGRVFETNQVFDTPERGLRHADTLLRLRRTRSGAGTQQGLLTLKRPPDDKTAADQGFKVWEESETRVENPDAVEQVLRGLGYTVAFRYEKVRETWLLPGVKVLLDRLPFGRYVEMEGTADAVRQWAPRLGLDMGSATDKTYHQLNREHRSDAGLPPDESFVFSPEEREALEA